MLSTYPINAIYDMTYSNQLTTNFPKDLVIEPTQNSPFMKYSFKNKTLTIVGSSFMENAHDYYEPFLSKVYDDLMSKNHANVELYFTSFGPKTAKMLFEFFGNLRTFNQTGKTVEVLWKANEEDENMAELGISFAELFDLNIKIVHS